MWSEFCSLAANQMGGGEYGIRLLSAPTPQYKFICFLNLPQDTFLSTVMKNVGLISACYQFNRSQNAPFSIFPWCLHNFLAIKYKLLAKTNNYLGSIALFNIFLLTAIPALSTRM